MSKTFNADLWLYLRDNTTLFNKKIYFGLAPEDVSVPYCVLHVLDSGVDDRMSTLCKNDTDYNRAGISDIQFSIYAINDLQLDEKLQELNSSLLSLKNLTEYRIINSTRTSTKTASSFSNEVGEGITRLRFEYEHL